MTDAQAQAMVNLLTDLLAECKAINAGLTSTEAQLAQLIQFEQIPTDRTYSS